VLLVMSGSPAVPLPLFRKQKIIKSLVETYQRRRIQPLVQYRVTHFVT